MTVIVTSLPGEVWKAETPEMNAIATSATKTAADAAALAAAPATFPALELGDPRVVAGQAALQNGARLIECVCATDESFDARTALVRVEVGVEVPVVGLWTIEATSAARFEPAVLVGQ